MPHRFLLSIVEPNRPNTSVDIEVRQVLLAGYTGRDLAKVMEHIEELEQLGVPPPPRVPMVYVVDGGLLTTDARITVRHGETSGEAEFYLVLSGQGLLVGVGSDHTDRREEAVDVQSSKGLCPKVISREVWRHEEVRGHWDRLELRSWSTSGGSRRLYQEGRLNAFFPVEAILAEVRTAAYVPAKDLVFSGTLPTIGGLAYGDRFEAELRDPVLGRTLSLAYDVAVSETLT